MIISMSFWGLSPGSKRSWKLDLCQAGLGQHPFIVLIRIGLHRLVHLLDSPRSRIDYEEPRRGRLGCIVPRHSPEATDEVFRKTAHSRPCARNRERPQCVRRRRSDVVPRAKLRPVPAPRLLLSVSPGRHFAERRSAPRQRNMTRSNPKPNSVSPNVPMHVCAGKLLGDRLFLSIPDRSRRESRCRGNRALAWPVGWRRVPVHSRGPGPFLACLQAGGRESTPLVYRR